jgi:hypothetical protein
MIYTLLGACIPIVFALGFWLGAKLTSQGVAERLSRAQASEFLRNLEKGKRL